MTHAEAIVRRTHKMTIRRTQDRFRDAAGDAWKWTRKGWRRVWPKRKIEETKE